MIGIGGGVGPAAGILLHQLVLQHTKSGGVDQGHLDVFHLSRSADIASRVNFLAVEQDPTTSSKQNLPENPANGMARTFAMLQAAAGSGNKPLVVGIPCLTFHVPSIWDEFLRLTKLQLCTDAPNKRHYYSLTHEQSEPQNQVKCLHMLQETVWLIPQLAPSSRVVGVMCTNGTRQAAIFDDVLTRAGYSVLYVPQDMQVELHDTIQNPEWGIKSQAPPTISQRCIDNFHRYARHLITMGAQVLVLGCTEIPFAFQEETHVDGVVLVDPLLALARGLIREVEPLRLKPLTVGAIESQP